MRCVFCNHKLVDKQFVVIFKWRQVIEWELVEVENVHDEVTDAIACGPCMKKRVLCVV